MCFACFSDESDYTATLGMDTIVIFTNTQRRSCVDIMITNDNVYENDERFFLRLADLGGSFALSDNFFLSPNISEINVQDNESENLVMLCVFCYEHNGTYTIKNNFVYRVNYTANTFITNSCLSSNPVFMHLYKCVLF